MHRLLALLLLALAGPAAAQSSATVSTSGLGKGRASASVTAAFGMATRINRMALTPVAIVEDSRCPPNVNCVWAGRLVVEFRERPGGKLRLELGRPVTTRGGRLTLVNANGPGPAGTRMLPREYRFQLRFERP